jgi:hypothetical protein
MNVYKIAEFLKDYWAFIALILPFLVGGVGLLLNGRLKGEAQRVVGAVYRAAIHEALETSEGGADWLISPYGVEFRKKLIERAYDCLPDHIGFVPVGLIKAFVSREQFVTLVERAFIDMVAVADRLEGKLLTDITLPADA